MNDELYLGGVLDDAGEITDRALLPSDRLSRHGVIIGMTGSGKTGLGVALVEELVLGGVPVIALDPKGDLGNLALLFPKLAPEDFAPWVESSEPGRAEKVAGKWKKGLADWGIAPERLAALSDRLALSVYTPGSSAGTPVDVLGALGAPAQALREDTEGLRATIRTTVSALLELVGVSVDPLTAPEHILLSRLVEDAWTAGRSADLASLVLGVMDPPFEKVGVFPVDRFFSPSKRDALARKLNAVLASPGFAVWTSGQPLDVEQLFSTARGTVPVSVFHLSHLSDRERQFFCGLLLQRIVAWSRSQPGSSKLRAVLLLDEAFGFLPPHPANPASKAPLLTLMKQARAVGLGVVLATQNPVDLDYKALTNAGTWLIGRLSTQNDVRRVAEGLRMAGGGDASDQIGGLAPRQFLMREVGSGSPQRIQSRWAMSYLRGPITSAELRRLPGLTVPTPVIPSAAPSPSPVAADPVSAVAVAAPVAAVAVVAPPPALPRGTEARWLDEHAVFAARMGGTFDAYREAARPDGAVRYSPALLGLMRIRFDEEKDGFLSDETHARLVFPLEGSLTSVGAPVRSEDLSLEAPVRGTHDDLPSVLDESTELTAARKRMVEEVYRRETRGQWVCAAYKLRGKAGESREDFESRCRAAAEEKVDTDLEKLAKRTETKVERLRKKVRKTEAKIEDYEGRLKSERTSELVNGMEILSSFFFGRSRSLSTVASRRKATSAAGRRLEDAGEDLVALQEEIDELTEELEEQSETLREDALAKAAEIEEREVRLEKNDIELLFFGILWVPVSSRV